jgi:hypothetical protein
VVLEEGKRYFEGEWEIETHGETVVFASVEEFDGLGLGDDIGTLEGVEIVEF